ncbi:hypothetical protein E2C01_089482 [Portunus trituberculatus]|uniref:Uncharacterized protein n=1 Tax=Portunus trituberculatus TaxID=210409 RepID=A0A5B7JMI1_PORTR|nr:hypothetical protein [Portunus trituberculatus]
MGLATPIAWCVTRRR